MIFSKLKKFLMRFFSLSATKLEEELDGWLQGCGIVKSPAVRGVIAP